MKFGGSRAFGGELVADVVDLLDTETGAIHFRLRVKHLESRVDEFILHAPNTKQYTAPDTY